MAQLIGSLENGRATHIARPYVVRGDVSGRVLAQSWVTLCRGHSMHNGWGPALFEGPLSSATCIHCQRKLASIGRC